MPAKLHTADQVSAALVQAGGNRSEAARLLDCAWQTVQRWIDSDPAVRAAYEAVLQAGGGARQRRAAEVIAAITQAGGNLAEAARILHCGPGALYRWIDADPAVRAAYEAAAADAREQRQRRIEEVIAALREAGGNRHAAAVILGCTRQSLNHYLCRYPEVAAALDGCLRERDEALERRLDDVEAALRRCGGSRRRAATLLGLPESTLRHMVDRHPRLKAACVPQPTGGPHGSRFTPEDMIAALHACGGLKSHTARFLGCSPATVYKYIHRYPQVRQAADDAREAILDLAEMRLREAVDRGEWQAIRYVLSTLGRSRGYTFKDNPRPPFGHPEPDDSHRRLMADIERIYGSDDDNEDNPR